MKNEEKTITDTYKEVERLIWNEIHSFRRTYGYHFDEDDLLSEANEAFLKAYNTFDEDKGKFSTYLTICIYRRFLDVMYNKQQQNRLRTVSLDTTSTDGSLHETISAKQELGFNFEEYVEGWTEDSKTILRLILQTPTELSELVSGKGGEPRNWRSSIREYLLACGWDWYRVSDTYKEIRAVLS